MPTPEKTYGQVCVMSDPDSRLPKIPDESTIYIQETGEGHARAVLRCPCGCGQRIELPLRPVCANEDADWSATIDEGTVTFDNPIEISPKLCGSRFSIERNVVRWQGQ